MTIQTKLTIGGTQVFDYKNLRVSRSLQEFNKASNFSALIDTPFGRHSSSFTVGQEVQIFADKDATPTTKIFTGILEKIKFKGHGNTQTVTLSGRDYTARLQDSTVAPIVYTNSEISTIVTDIINNNVRDITTSNVNVTPETLTRISYNDLDVFSAFNELANLAGFVFYIDEDKDLHFELKNETSSGITLNNTNVLDCRFDETRERMANKIKIYGDRYLAGFREVNTLDGSPWGGAPGSVFTLLNKPHNTFIEFLGNPQQGGIFDMVSQPISGTNYLVSFHDKQIVFISGTNIGDSIPLSGGSIVTTYNRELPIVKIGQNDASISAFGPKTKIINDKSIKDPTTAKDILISEIEKANPFKGIVLKYKGWNVFTPGNTIDVVLSDFGINNTSQIIDVTYTFDKNTIQSENVITLKLDKKILEVTDALSELKRRLDIIEAQDRQDTDIITRLLQSTGSFLVVGSRWEVKTRSIAGENLILDSPNFGILDTNKLASGIVQSFVLGRALSAVLGTSQLGQNLSTYSIIASGGYTY